MEVDDEEPQAASPEVSKAAVAGSALTYSVACHPPPWIGVLALLRDRARDLLTPVQAAQHAYILVRSRAASATLVHSPVLVFHYARALGTRGHREPEFQELHRTLDSYLSDVTRRVIATAIHGDVSEPEVRRKRVELLPGSTFEIE